MKFYLDYLYLAVVMIMAIFAVSLFLSNMARPIKYFLY